VQRSPVGVSALIPAGDGTGGRSLLPGFESRLLRGYVDLSLARQEITPTAIATFAEPLIDIEIARIMACRAKVPWGDLHRLPLILVKDHRQTVICPANSFDGHHDPPLYRGAAHASYQLLREAIPPLLEAPDRSRVDRSQAWVLGDVSLSYPFDLLGSRMRMVSCRHAAKLDGEGILQTANRAISMLDSERFR
jgi:hypothetical protein